MKRTFKQRLKPHRKTIFIFVLLFAWTIFCYYAGKSLKNPSFQVERLNHLTNQK